MLRSPKQALHIDKSVKCANAELIFITLQYLLLISENTRLKTRPSPKKKQRRNQMRRRMMMKSLVA